MKFLKLLTGFAFTGSPRLAPMNKKTKSKKIVLKEDQKRSYEDFLLENIDEALKTKKEEGYYARMESICDGKLTKRQWRTLDARSDQFAFSNLIKRRDISAPLRLRINDFLQEIYSIRLDQAEQSEMPTSVASSFMRIRLISSLNGLNGIFSEK